MMSTSSALADEIKCPLSCWANAHAELQGAKSQAVVRFDGLQACSAAWLTVCNECHVFTVSVAGLVKYPLIKL